MHTSDGTNSSSSTSENKELYPIKSAGNRVAEIPAVLANIASFLDLGTNNGPNFCLVAKPFNRAAKLRVPINDSKQTILRERMLRHSDWSIAKKKKNLQDAEEFPNELRSNKVWVLMEMGILTLPMFFALIMTIFAEQESHRALKRTDNSRTQQHIVLEIFFVRALILFMLIGGIYTNYNIYRRLQRILLFEQLNAQQDFIREEIKSIELYGGNKEPTATNK